MGFVINLTGAKKGALGVKKIKSISFHLNKWYIKPMNNVIG